ncbi:MAG: hypothetical protein HY537_17645 [Deltaproteobacteria bacterium]|nr:hypothetical protein [Deltaproteobacteria bacterium]
MNSLSTILRVLAAVALLPVVVYCVEPLCPEALSSLLVRKDMALLSKINSALENFTDDLLINELETLHASLNR